MNQSLSNFTIHDMLLELCARLKVDPQKIEPKRSKSKPDTYYLNNLTDNEVIEFSANNHNLSLVKYAAQHRKLHHAIVNGKLFASKNRALIDAKRLLGRKMFDGVGVGQSAIVPIRSLKSRERIIREVQGIDCDLMIVSNEAHIYMRLAYEKPMNFDALQSEAKAKGLLGLPQFKNGRTYWTRLGTYAVNDDGCTIGAML